MLHKDSNIILPETFDLPVKLKADSQFKDFFLVGGTAMALRFGHRLSVDIDLFTLNNFDSRALNDYLVETTYGLKTTTI